jgi:hypothetical protein
MELSCQPHTQAALPLRTESPIPRKMSRPQTRSEPGEALGVGVFAADENEPELSIMLRDGRC